MTGKAKTGHSQGPGSHPFQVSLRASPTLNSPRLGNAHEILACLPFPADLDAGICHGESQALVGQQSYLGTGQLDFTDNQAAKKKCLLA